MNPVTKENCCEDPFISSEPYGEKQFLHPWKTDERKGDWYHNRAYCAEHCAEMVTIDSNQENEFFHGFMRSVGMKHPGAWLGAQIKQKQKPYTWYNGKPLAYSVPAPGEYNEEGLTCLDVGWENARTWWRNWYCTGDVSDRHLIACQRIISKNTSEFCYE